MSVYEITDEESGVTFTMEGDEPPTPEDIDAAVESLGISKGVDLSPTEMLKNTPESALNLVKDIGMAVMNPIDTVHNMGRAADGVVDKMGYNIPGTEDNEPVADAVGRGIQQRYGSWDNTKRTMNTDPVGAVADVAGLLMGGAGAARSGATIAAKHGVRGAQGIANGASRVQRAAAAVEPLNLATKTAAKGVGAVARNAPYLGDWMKNIDAGGMYADANKFRPSIEQEQRSRMGRTALDNDISPTRKGMDRLQDLGDSIDAEIDRIVATAEGSGTKLNTRHIRKKLEELRTSKLKGFNLESGAQSSIVDDMIAKLDDEIARNGRSWMSADEMLGFKRRLYADTEYGADLPPDARNRNEARQTAARGAKETFEILSSDVRGLNSTWADLLELSPELERAVSRMGNNQPISIRSPIAAGGGSALSGGSPAGAWMALAADHMLNSSGMRTRLAKLVRGIQTGSTPPTSIPWAVARVATTLAGRTDEELEEMGLFEP